MKLIHLGLIKAQSSSLTLSVGIVMMDVKMDVLVKPRKPITMTPTTPIPTPIPITITPIPIPTTPIPMIQKKRLMKNVVLDPTKTNCSTELWLIKLRQLLQTYPSKNAKLLAPTTLILLCKIVVVSAGVKITFKESPCMDQQIVTPMVVAYATMSMIIYALEVCLLLDKSSTSILTLLGHAMMIQTDG